MSDQAVVARQQQVEIAIGRDELLLLQIIREKGPDANFEIFKREGKIVNCLSTTVHVRDFKAADGKLREVGK
jgi:hypothetical protein